MTRGDYAEELASQTDELGASLIVSSKKEVLGGQESMITLFNQTQLR